MAALLQSAVTINNIYYEGAEVGSKRKVLDVTLVMVTAGTIANPINASLFGLTYIDKAWGWRDSDSAIQLAGPSWDNTKLCLYDIEAATDAARKDPADFNSITIRGWIAGRE